MLSATPLNLKDEDLFNQLHILNPSLFPDIQTFQALLSPVKAINRCRQLIAQNTSQAFEEAILELDKIESGSLGSAISNHPDVVTLKRKLNSKKELSSEETAEYDRILISLSPLDNSFTRTLKREALGRIITREPIKVPVVLSKKEWDFHEQVIEAVKEAFRARGGDPRAEGFIINMPRRMVSSCMPAMREYLEWILENDQLIMDEPNRKEIVDDDSDLPTIPLPPELRETFEKLKNQAEALGEEDTKFQEFKKLLDELQKTLKNPQVIVFSFFVRTLKYLKKRLKKEGYSVGLICGETPISRDQKQPGRFDIMEGFEKGEFDILLSSEVGGEGLDFQFCQAIINYDLPYNPMRIEQRIGRIDRFGQSADKVFIASMYISDTVDENIYMALYDRIHLVEESIGGLEPILGTRLIDLQKEIISGQLSEEQLNDRVKDLEIALEKAKLEREQFEKNRSQLMGDDYFTDPLHNLDHKNSFVKPYDAAYMTRMYLTTLAKCSYKELDNDRAEINLSKEVLARLEAFTRRPGSEGSIAELSPLLKTCFPGKFLFNGSLAHQYNDHIFLPPTGFWTRFLISEMEVRREIHKVFCFHYSNGGTYFSQGKYLVPLFEIKLEGFRVELDIAAVPVNIEKESVSDCDFRVFSRDMIEHIADCGRDIEIPEIDAPETIIDLGAEALEQQMAVRLEKLHSENKYRVNARIDSLKRGSEVRIDRLKQKIDDHVIRRQMDGKEPSNEFIKLTERTIENEKIRTEEKIENLQTKGDLSMTVALIGLVVMLVE